MNRTVCHKQQNKQKRQHIGVHTTRQRQLRKTSINKTNTPYTHSKRHIHDTQSRYIGSYATEQSTTTNTAASTTSPIDNSTTAVEPDDTITSRGILEAFERLRGKISRAPLEYSSSFSQITGAQVYFKKEHSTSVTGSFKERGALNKLLSLTPEERRRGVICSSAGNHAQAVSLWATRLGIDSVIVMPQTTPYVKVQKTSSFGGKVIQSGTSFGEAYAFARELGDFENRVFIHAFNDKQIAEGAGTIAVELLEQQPFLDAVIVPVGGGGMLAGMATLIKAINPRISVYGVEAALMPGMLKSLEAGHVVSTPKQPTMADGIAIELVGNIPFPAIQKCVDKIVTVSEDDLAHTVLQLLELDKTLVEPAGAAALTALCGPLRHELQGKQVGVVLSGSNIDMSLLGRILNKGLVRSGQLARISVTIRDIPGQLAKICQICADMGISIREVKHERAFLLDTVGITQPIIDIEIRNFEHLERLVERIRGEEFLDCHVITPYHSNAYSHNGGK